LITQRGAINLFVVATTLDLTFSIFFEKSRFRWSKLKQSHSVGWVLTTMMKQTMKPCMMASWQSWPSFQSFNIY